jgi:hypothetical protein
MTPSTSNAASAFAPLSAHPGKLREDPMSEPIRHLPTKAETISQRIRRLQQEARLLAKDHVSSLVHALAEVEQIAAAIAEGGEAYPAGIRDLARRLVEDAESKAQTLEAISARPA